MDMVQVKVHNYTWFETFVYSRRRKRQLAPAKTGARRASISCIHHQSSILKVAGSKGAIFTKRQVARAPYSRSGR